MDEAIEDEEGDDEEEEEEKEVLRCCVEWCWLRVLEEESDKEVPLPILDPPRRLPFSGPRLMIASSQTRSLPANQRSQASTRPYAS